MASAPDYKQTYDLIVVGTGFASSFFLSQYLKQCPANARILVLERGFRESHAWQMKTRQHSRIAFRDTFSTEGMRNKSWEFTVAYGGGSNSWWAVVPRMLPNDFRLRSLYGVGRDWPISYEDLEPWYQDAEEIMEVAGPNDGSPYPRTAPYPQPPHRMSDPDKLLARGFPDHYFAAPAARARLPTRNRPACCASGWCMFCPVDAKFTITNGLDHLYDDPRVSLVLDAQVLAVDKQGSTAKGVIFRQQGREITVKGDLVALGANAIFNPLILMHSGLHHPLLGKRLHEQVTVNAQVFLDGVDNFQGSTSVTGLGYMLYDGPHRKKRAACLIESLNSIHTLRPEFGKWRQILRLQFVYEDIPEERNYVKPSAEDPHKPVAVFKEYSDYAYRGIKNLREQLPRILKPLPVEKVITDPKPRTTDAHIQGTTVMGDDATRSIVDRDLVHHKVRNLLVLGSSVFPSCSPANPTLTLCALSLRSAHRLLSSKA